MDSLGRTTCLTGTDTVGANYNAGAGASVISKVDGTAGSVKTALDNIANGTLTGLVPAVSLINAVAAANDAVAAYGKTVAAANPAFDNAPKDGSVSFNEVKDAAAAAAAARETAVKAADATLTGKESTVLLNAKQTDAGTLVGTTKATLLAATSAANKVLVTNYDNAVTARAALETTAAQKAAFAVALATNKEGTVQAVDAAGATVTLATLSAATGGAYTSVGDVYTALTSPTTLNAEQRIALVNELSKIPTFGSALVAQANQELAVNKANALITSTKDAVDGLGAEGTAYTKAVDDKVKIDAAVAAAKAADVKVDAIKVILDQYTALNKGVADTTKALTDFKAANAEKVSITDLTTSVDATAKQDVFYFGHKVSATDDFSIGASSVAFGAGDSIVLGSGYTFNSGALSTGNANTLEFFLVKGATGTQIVIETEAYGNSTTVVAADGTVTASPNAAVINLVGVTADHLSIANGVISYV